MKLLSVIVPVYGVEKYIVKCVASLLDCHSMDYEVLIVNDGTRDRSIELVESSFSDDRIRIVNKINGGLSSARNAGIEKAEGKYLWFVDSDDWVESSKLPELLNLLRLGRDMVYMPSYFRESETSDLSVIVSHKVKSGSISDLYASDYQHSACMYVFKKEILLKNSLFFKEGIFHEDSLFTPQLSAFCKTFAIFPHPVYHYLDRPGSITNANEDKRVRDLAYISDSLMDFADKMLPADMRFVWGKCISSTLNEMMFISVNNSSSDLNKFVSGYCRNNRRALSYMLHSGLNNKIMAILAIVCSGELYKVYRFLYCFRYGF